jgi:hypothetical protein
MSTVKEIESAIAGLSPKEIAELRSWFQKFAAQFSFQESQQISRQRLRSQYADPRVRADAERVNDQFPGSEDA